MNQFKNYIADIVKRGIVKADRTGVGTVSAFGHFLRFDLREGFPLETLKKTPLKPIAAELLWFLEGSTDNNRLNELGATIWDEWALPDGSLGPIYGAQWRSWQVPEKKDHRSLWTRLKAAFKGEATPTRPYDQISAAIRMLRENPTSRRIVISGWNCAVLPDEGSSPQWNVLCGKQALPPCHMSFVMNASPIRIEDRIQYYVDSGVFPDLEKAKAGLAFAMRGVAAQEVDAASHEWLDSFGGPRYSLNGLLTQRSSDALLGASFNIASYSLLLSMVAQVVKMVPGEFCMAIADGHIYLNHLHVVEELLSREPYQFCRLVLNPNCTELEDFTMDDIEVENYVSHPRIKLDVAV